MKKILLLSILLCSHVFSTEDESERYASIYLRGHSAYLKMNIKDLSSTGVTGAGAGAKLGGVIGGGTLGFDYKQYRSLYTSLQTTLSYGELSTRSGPFFPNRDIWEVEAEGRFGYNYRGLQGNRMMVTPYIGLGFSYTKEERSKSGADPSINFSYYVYYIPVGMILNYEIFDWMYVGFHFKWYPDIDPTVKDSLLRGARLSLQKESDQLLVELPIEFRLGSNHEGYISLAPYWRRKKFGSTENTISTLVTAIPKQTLIFWGAYLEGGYRF